jgi:two-component system LytT family sensor kinase
MKIHFDKKRLRVYGWIALAYVVICVLHNLAQNDGSTGARCIDDWWRMLYVIPVNYLFLERTIPGLSWKRFGRGFLLIVGYLLLYSEGLFLWRQLGVAIGFYTPIPAGSHEVAAQMEFSVGAFFFFGVILYIYNHNRLKKTAQQLLIEKQQAELSYLKSQTNPHFLFNTLNNIYSLSRDKSDLAPEAILRLSKILRYMLYEAGGAYIAIEEELKIIGDYISLEKLRYDESLRVNFNYDVEDMKQSLPPLLLMPLVENAFKHGASETRHQPFVDIHLSVAKRRLALIVRNSADGLGGDGKPRENIGLSNLRRQLELLYADHQLLVEQRAAEFCATLTINLASHV